MTDVSVVIVNYNVKDLVDNCISSIYKANSGKYAIEIFFVDNNSIDGSADHITAKYPEVKVIRNDVNIGFSKANNMALKLASGKYLLILNPDTLLEEGTFERLIEFCGRHIDAGAVTSKLILANGKLDSACRRSFPTLSVALSRITGLSKLFPKSKIFGKYNLTYLDENITHETDAICGAFMFIPKKVLEETGLFDEDYFMYGEDLDLCFRIKKKGYKIYYFPEVTTIHFKGESTRKTNLSYVNNFYGAMKIFVRKNFTGLPRILSIMIQLGIYGRSFISYLKRISAYIFIPLIDIGFLFLAFILSIKIRFDIFPTPEYLFIITVYLIVWLIIFSVMGLYSKKNFLSVKKAFNGLIIGFFINSSITYFFNEYAFSRGVILASTLFGLVFLIFWRAVVKSYMFFVSKNILLSKVNLLIVGKEKLNQNTEDKLNSKYNVSHFDEIGKKKSISELEETIQIGKFDEVVFTGNYFSNQDILNLIWDFRNRNVRFKIFPSGKELILSKLNTNSLDEINLIEIEYNINNKLNIFLKRLFDLLLSFLLLVTIYPVIYLLKRFSGMEFSKKVSKLFLLPEVFTGKYSFVGYPVWQENNRLNYTGKRGLTGLIQLNYYNGITEEEMDNFNIFYAKNQSILLDTEILLKTFFSVFKK
ncbi:MAG: hypothetical protein HGGPFJEG_02244 [Ignavibacteria bacterium]|nr:hypothetical protein [Ignavibacteria bacterium]